MPIFTDDLAFVARIVGGDEQAAEEFVSRYLPTFIYLARRAHVPAQDCQDVAQEICLAAMSQMRRMLFRGESQLTTWLSRIARGKIADYWQAHSAAGSLIVSSIDELEANGCLDGAMLAVKTDFEIVLAVREALSEMLPLQRAVLLLNRSEKRSVAEICRMLGMTKAQVNGRLKQAEEKFRSCLRDEAPVRPLLPATVESEGR